MREKLEALKKKFSKCSDFENPLFIFQQTSTDILCKMASGEVNVQDLVEIELMQRGLNANGTWVGFSQARTYWTNRNNQK